MSQVEEYDVVVLGCGDAGKFIAWSVAKQGQRTAVIERQYVGGSCPTVACLPSKNVIHGAKVASYFRGSAEFGVICNDWKIDMQAVRERKRTMVDSIIAIQYDKFRESGAELVMGQGRFVAPKTIEVRQTDGSRRTLRGRMIVVSTGSRSRIDPIMGLTDSEPMTHVEALELDYVPNHLVVMGGGYVGLEFAQTLRRFGSRVTIIERNDALAHHEDDDVTEALGQLFRDEGIEVLTETQVDRVEGRSGETVRLFVTRKGVSAVIEATDLLVASGRYPNTDGIGLEVAGVEIDSKGFIKVDERLRSTADGVWAVGDCAGSPHFTHIAYDDFRVVRDNLAGIDRVTTGRLVPYCLFTDPELGRVGLSEKQARSRGIEYRLSKLPLTAIRRAWTMSELRGFYKILIDTNSDRILGFTAFGPHAGDVISTVQLAMTAGLPYTVLSDAIMTHPTMCEGLIALCRDIPSRN
ncbi:MAG: pyruvate/2-oxoglutarate dehydrogenase complex, dihydrolipoamide dehydrogenase component [Schlesneria sp.]|nr:pyruvate/2-oxoglutarate dehydrogenase complex, dihydrolipoamide dehydrogenase component [Schlesneria sp.]